MQGERKFETATLKPSEGVYKYKSECKVHTESPIGHRSAHYRTGGRPAPARSRGGTPGRGAGITGCTTHHQAGSSTIRYRGVAHGTVTMVLTVPLFAPDTRESTKYTDLGSKIPKFSAQPPLPHESIVLQMADRTTLKYLPTPLRYCTTPCHQAYRGTGICSFF